MTYAENNRLSHRQIYRQLCLSLLAPFLLCLFGRNRLNGVTGVAGTLAAMVLLCFYVIFLVRLAPHYEELGKAENRILAWIAAALFSSYIVLTAAYLLFTLAEIVPTSLLEGVSGKWITFFAALACAMGTRGGLPGRGRIAEVSAGLFLGAAALMMLLSIGQARPDYLRELGTSETSAAAFFTSLYICLCAFSGIGLLPFALGEAEKQGSSRKPVLYAILTVGGVLLAMQLLLPAVFGGKRLLGEPYPILPLLAGANLPGNVLARFDVLWMGVVLYGMLFAIGSLFFYGNRLFLLPRGSGDRKAAVRRSPEDQKETIRHGFDICSHLFLAMIAWLFSFLRIGGYEISEYYLGFLAYFFVPVLLIFQIYLLTRPGKRKRLGKALALAGVFCFLTMLSGCTGIDPEKRLYPLAMGMDKAGEEYILSYGIPRLPQATGQSRPQERNSSYLAFTGKTFQEIGEAYDRSQEKYPDLGHLQVLLLGKGILESGDWDLVFDYLRQEPMVGENVYLFYAQDPSEILDWQGESGTSVGEYLTGILENRMDGVGKAGLTLREAYHQFYENGSLSDLPEVRREGETLSIYGLHDKNKAVVSGQVIAWWGTLYPQFCFSGDPDHAKKVKITFWLVEYAKKTKASFRLAKVLNW